MTRNSTTDWGWPAKILHWVGAVMILLLLVHGWWMTHMTPRPDRLANYAWHSAMGYDLLVLLILRLLWRWLNPSPELPAELQRWERGSKSRTWCWPMCLPPSYSSPSPRRCVTTFSSATTCCGA